MHLVVSMIWCPLFVADLVVGMEELELLYRCRGRSNVRKIRIATISVRMVVSWEEEIRHLPPDQKTTLPEDPFHRNQVN